MERLGLLDAIRSYGQPIDRLLGKAGQRTILDVRYDALKGSHSGLAVHRAALFDVLYQAALSEQIPIRTGHDITHVTGEAIHFMDGTFSAGFGIIIDSLGVNSPLKPAASGPLKYGALWATLNWNPDDGFDPHMLSQRYQAARKMIGVLPVGTLPGDTKPKLTFFWSLKHRDYDAWLSHGLEPWKDEVLALWPETAPLLRQITSPKQLTLAKYAHQTISPPFKDRCLHIGDAWHCASPQLGQGANMALLDSWALSQAVEKTGSPEAAFATFYDARRRHIWLYQLMAQAFTPVYQSDGLLIPWLRDNIVPAVARIWPFPPLLAAIVAGLVGRPLRKLGLDASAIED